MDTLQSFTSITVGVQRMDRRGGERGREGEGEKRVEKRGQGKIMRRGDEIEEGKRGNVERRRREE